MIHHPNFQQQLVRTPCQDLRVCPDRPSEHCEVLTVPLERVGELAATRIHPSGL